MRRLTQITVQGYKSIKDQTLDLGRLNVLIGGNGVGKSNLIGVFKFLRSIYDRDLQTTVGIAGGANALLHFGRKSTKRLRLKCTFQNEGEAKSHIYRIDLTPNDQDQFTFELESVGTHDPETGLRAWDELSSRAESTFKQTASSTQNDLLDDLASYRVYHFHDTGSGALVKQTGDVNDNQFLQTDARNLAAFLYWMKLKRPDHLRMIEEVVRQIAPFFDRFELTPSRNNEDKIRLEWREQGSESYFNAHQLSDGTLRFICLVTLLLQPDVPRLVLLDEPELGLHPAGIVLLAELLKQTSQRSQLLIATQSVTLVNQLDPEDVFVADRADGATVFRNLGKEDLSEWTGAYALGELWEKNVLGGRP